MFLNGRELGRHANMFREAAFDVTGRVRPGAENLLAVRFDPPLAHAGPRDPEQWSSTPAERVWMRKAQYGFGWDWGPRLPTIGLWRPVELRTERQAALTRVNFATLAIGRTALVRGGRRGRARSPATATWTPSSSCGRPAAASPRAQP